MSHGREYGESQRERKGGMSTKGKRPARNFLPWRTGRGLR
ncbi:hypothetical protein SS05631_c19230 [Sinorhizobium sp. CCBAU 05631]|nr:hypothetical protein SS05631_c19230 [Sinorhizobium sp. CCBAU 05631]